MITGQPPQAAVVAIPGGRRLRVERPLPWAVLGRAGGCPTPRLRVLLDMLQPVADEVRDMAVVQRVVGDPPDLAVPHEL